MTATPTLNDLVSFDGTDGSIPRGGLVLDANGDLFGTTSSGGSGLFGTVFEIAKSGTGYADTRNVLVNFNSINGMQPGGSLIIDANGDLFGTTSFGGSLGGGSGEVFEVSHGPGGYAGTASILAGFNAGVSWSPMGSLFVDAAGNLFGTTKLGGTSENLTNGSGTVFEIAATASGYSSTPSTLASFGPPYGSMPLGGLIADANGDLFGTTSAGGANTLGEVFEIARTPGGYASTPIALASFNGLDGQNPSGSLIADANGDLFGTTAAGGDYAQGTVFEIVRTQSGYSSTPIVLASFNSTDGAQPLGTLIADANGNLFGTTSAGGTDNDGTVFELVRTGSSYTIRTLASFNGDNGKNPGANLIVDASGNLFGTTENGGADGGGCVFEITNSGFVPFAAPTITTLTGSANSAVVTTGQVVTLTLTLSQVVTVGFDAPTLALNNGGAARYVGGSGSNALTFDYIAGAGQRAVDLATAGCVLNGAVIGNAAGNPADLSGIAAIPSGTLLVTGETKISDVTGDGTSDILFRDPANGWIGSFLMTNGQPAWATIGWASPGLQVAGVGDFNGDGTADILLRDPNSGGIGQFAMYNGQPTFAAIGWADPSLQIAGVGDFNGDGTADILFRNPINGAMGDFVMNNGLPVWAPVGWTATNWQIAGIGDFNGDGTDDILFRDPTYGAIGMFEMHDNVPTWVPIGVADPSLQLAGIGDFTGNGTDDILFRNTTTGAMGDFLMQNGSPTWAPVGQAATNLQVAGIGDYYGSGTDDILLSDPTTGGLGMFRMDNNVPTWVPVGATTTNWQIVG